MVALILVLYVLRMGDRREKEGDQSDCSCMADVVQLLMQKCSEHDF